MTCWAGASPCAATAGRPTVAGSEIFPECSWMCVEGQAGLSSRRSSQPSNYTSYNDYGDYRIWPGPNSNTFTATVLRAAPELQTTLPPNAVGKDFRDGPYLGLTDSGTGVEASLWGILGLKVGWVEGIELNFLGMVAGLDLRHPGLKLPGFGRVGIDDGTAIAAPAPSK